MILLTDAERRLAQYLAAKRYASNRSAGVWDGKIGPQGAAQTDLDGIAAEIAVARLLNLYPDTSISPRHGGAELVSRLGHTLDVKATRYAGGRLLAVAGKSAGDADVYVLVRVLDGWQYQALGWAWAGELLVPDNLVDLGHGPTYALPQSALHKEGL